MSTCGNTVQGAAPPTTVSLQGVMALTINDFQTDGTLVNPQANKGPTFVLWHLPYCRFCRNFAQCFRAFGAANAGRVTIAAVDCTTPANRSMISYLSNAPFSLSGFPTIIVYQNGKPCQVYTRSDSNEVQKLNEALASALRGCGSCTLSSCSL